VTYKKTHDKRLDETGKGGYGAIEAPTYVGTEEDELKPQPELEHDARVKHEDPDQSAGHH
jgi:hypothetical protein